MPLNQPYCVMLRCALSWLFHRAKRTEKNRLPWPTVSYSLYCNRDHQIMPYWYCASVRSATRPSYDSRWKLECKWTMANQRLVDWPTLHAPMLETTCKSVELFSNHYFNQKRLFRRLRDDRERERESGSGNNNHDFTFLPCTVVELHEMVV